VGRRPQSRPCPIYESPFVNQWVLKLALAGRASRDAGIWSSDANSTIYSVLGGTDGTKKKACEERLHSP